mmetsp:Transcript_17348/g.23975  ORF Transcript_17348/g.23975 Transcript_17348/m.23975 type:complete len:261 (-) Transcript_17348:505-1287(-)
MTPILMGRGGGGRVVKPDRCTLFKTTVQEDPWGTPACRSCRHTSGVSSGSARPSARTTTKEPFFCDAPSTLIFRREPRSSTVRLVFFRLDGLTTFSSCKAKAPATHARTAEAWSSTLGSELGSVGTTSTASCHEQVSRSLVVDSAMRPFSRLTGRSLTLIRGSPAGSWAARRDRTSSGFSFCVSSTSRSSELDEAPRGRGRAALIRGREWYGDSSIATGSAALRKARSNTCIRSKCPMYTMLPNFPKRNSRRCARVASGT